METTFKVKWRPFGDCSEENWRPTIKLSIVSSIFGCNNFGLKKMVLIFFYSAFLSSIFNLFDIYIIRNDSLSNIKEQSINACLKAKFCNFSHEILRISISRESLT